MHEFEVFFFELSSEKQNETDNGTTEDQRPVVRIFHSILPRSSKNNLYFVKAIFSSNNL